ncbi:BTAD domain-containing putative transcriptional regulator [Actinokineospora sp. HUAS TT18]|uniref:BTAD domain-containing putative transcriptional regulator n=1 Tax=Actinokineospora sp. HUAS TT18 TaxID=3447451 RepID=UPI003F522D0A
MVIAPAALLALVGGVPWALWQYIGWPLPDHVPTWAEVQAVLLGPMTTSFLLGALACACWIAWAAFTVDVVRCTLDLARSGFDASRMVSLSAAGPVRALARALVGAVLLSVLGHRAALAAANPWFNTSGNAAQVVATAPAWEHSAAPGDVSTLDTVVGAPNSDPTAGVTATANPRVVTVVVRAPHAGVHDSLWRIAKRALGDGARWPEIWEANKGKPQPGGHVFTRPSLVFPGQELLLPADMTTSAPASPHARDNPTPAPVTPAPSSTTPPTSVSPTPFATNPAAPATPSPATDLQPTVAREPGIAWGAELFVGAGLAAAVSAALLVARRRYRARYRPGSGDRDDLPVAPVVYQLHLAHLNAGNEDDLDNIRTSHRDGGDAGVNGAVVVGGALAGSDLSGGKRAAQAPGLGVRDGREIALDLAAARGLGLVGAGAPAAVRALLLAALTTERPAGSDGARVVVVPSEDLAAVVGHKATQVPESVCVVADLDAALVALEAETLVRAADHDQGSFPEGWPPLLLVSRPPQHHQRLQAVLDNGAPFGITGLLLGQWQPGITGYVREDGTISATDPGLGEALRGTRMFRLGRGDTADLLALLHHGQPPDGDRGDRGDDMAVSPMPRPRNDRVPGEPLRLRTHDTHPGCNAPATESTVDTRREATAANETAAHIEAELEILGQNTPLRPGVSERPQTEPRSAKPETPSPSETADPAPTDEPTRSAAGATDSAGAAPNLDNGRAQITITVLGGLRVHWHPDADDAEAGREITGALQPRSQVLLVLLALHPDGASRDTLVEALWGEDPPARPTNSLHTALSRLRRDLSRATGGAAAEAAVVDHGRYRLDPGTVAVDYWRFAAAVRSRRAATSDAERIAAFREIVKCYGGLVAEGMSRIEWLEPIREAIRRDAIDAVSGLARALVADDPQQTVDLLEIARAFDPHNELLYRDIMRLQQRLGQHDAIPRTLALLTTRLAEVDEKPTSQVRALADALLRAPTGPAS